MRNLKYSAFICLISVFGLMPGVSHAYVEVQRPVSCINTCLVTPVGCAFGLESTGQKCVCTEYDAETGCCEATGYVSTSEIVKGSCDKECGTGTKKCVLYNETTGCCKLWQEDVIDSDNQCIKMCIKCAKTVTINGVECCAECEYSLVKQCSKSSDCYGMLAWTDMSSDETKQTKCNTSTGTCEYQCKAGYYKYTSSGLQVGLTCKECPSGGTSDAGATNINQCYSTSFTDSKGVGTSNEKCEWVE